jgi:tRNA threonylcarbamoyladenosine biosynthesis protein TsaE
LTNGRQLTVDLSSEQELADFAGNAAQCWRDAACYPLVVGLEGGLGAGKTTWVRAMLRGLGHGGRVPSPTYTLLEHYAVGELTVVHLDLYRLRGDDELESLGLRDWLAEPRRWVAVEWPERAPQLEARCDLLLAFAETATGGRRVTATARARLGIEALRLLRDEGFNNDP